MCYDRQSREFHFPPNTLYMVKDINPPKLICATRFKPKKYAKKSKYGTSPACQKLSINYKYLEKNQ